MNDLIGVDELKKVELDILRYFRKFCNDRGLKYYLSDGTLLGAVRHKGFIPWDDDIDVIVPRSDFDDISKEFNVYAKGSPYRFVAPTDKDSLFMYGKIVDTRTIKIEGNGDIKYKYKPLGIDIDVFVLERYSASDEMIEKIDNKFKRCFFVNQCFISKSFHKTSRLIQFKYLYYKLKYITRARIMKDFVRYSKKYSDEAGKVCVRHGLYGATLFSSFEEFEPSKELEFEGEMFSVPNDYDSILKKLYGNYNELPPEDKRVTHHGFVAYRLKKDD